ncbi:MAG: peptidylprolyl isomerase [Rhodoferax sp.]|nr:peptidylprolyl isomerase [Rhodoferax sp.]
MKSCARALALAGLLTLGLSAPRAQTATSLDYIVAVVNSEPITFQDVERQVRLTQGQFTQQGQVSPATAEVRAAVLEQLINDKAQLQLARELGIRIDAATLDRAEQTLLVQSGMDLDQYLQKLAKEGVSYALFREQLRDQLLLGRLHEREVDSAIKVSDVDVDSVIQELKAGNTDPYAQEINLAQILLSVPEKASADAVASVYRKAQELQQRARSGEDFSQLVQEYSAGDRKNGGEIGLRRGDRLPPVFVEAAVGLQVGGVSEVVRTASGFHVLKLLERKMPDRLVQTTVQTRARHILLRNSPQWPTPEAVSRLSRVREQILSGTTDFASMARLISQDATAEQGGDLGWASAGAFVPEFEDAMNRLKTEGEISPPLVSRFGVHLIQLVDRRRVELSPQQVRESVRAQLRKSRYVAAYAAWARDVRARAFVELREAPQ